MRRIVLEEHFILNKPAHIERWTRTVPQMPQQIIEKLLTKLTDIGDLRLQAMAEAKVDFMVLSNIGSVQGVLDATPAMNLAKEANNYLAAAVQKHPDKFAGFATVPLQDPAAGADELERAVKQLGMKGVLILGHTNGQYLDDERFNPFWERAQALDVPVYLHGADAVIMPVTYAGHPEMIGATFSWTPETSGHTLRMIFGGVFKRYPKARLLLGHMGEALPFMLWRLDETVRLFHPDDPMPAEVIRKNVAITSSGVFSDEPLECSLKAMGEDSVMFSVDYPFENLKMASDWLDKAPLSDSFCEKFSSGNATRYLKL